MAKKKELARAETVLQMAKGSVTNFFDVYNKVHRTRIAGRGAPSDKEQDLLRAALVFAAAGLDSTLKELIKGSLRTLSKNDTSVQDQLEKFVQRKLRGDSNEASPAAGNKFLASILASAQPQERLLNEYVLDLTGNSLQSVKQLFKSADALGANTKLIEDDKDKLEKIFSARNQIIHELDVQFSGKVGRRTRKPKTQKQIREQCDLLLNVAEELIRSVDIRIRGGTP